MLKPYTYHKRDCDLNLKAFLMNALKCRTLGATRAQTLENAPAQSRSSAIERRMRECWKAHVLLKIKLALYTAGRAKA